MSAAISVTEPEQPSLRQRLRREVGAFLVDGFFKGTSQAGRLLPIAYPRLHNVEVTRNIAYRDTGMPEHRLDIYRPRGATGPLPVVLYLHGGGFRILSKESHWVFGLLFARRGFLVANISYRLAPKHRFPAAHEDAFAALEWTMREIQRYGGDPSQLVLAGESAGANLATSIAIATSYRRPEPWARRAFDQGIRPSAIIAGCGLHQVSDPERYSREGRISRFLQDRLAEVPEAYLAGADAPLADPVCILERAEKPERPLPPFFEFCGTWDVLIEDTRRLAAALDALGVTHEARYYKRGLHGFHAFVFDPNARQCWRDTFAFLQRVLPSMPAPATRLFMGER